jgi:glutamate dehydrogenase/leucine dehydrogenase
MARWTQYASHKPPTAAADFELNAPQLAALGVFHGVRAAARALGLELGALRVAVQGLGQVGYRLAKLLAAEGVRLVVADVDAGRVESARRELGAAAADAEALYAADVDVFSPNAAGGVVNDGTLPRLRCRAVVGGANEQLEEARHGDALHARGILYAPDYVVNAGGLLSLLYETGATDEAGVRERVRAIGDRLAGIWQESRTTGAAPHRVADRIAAARLAAARARRCT